MQVSREEVDVVEIEPPAARRRELAYHSCLECCPCQGSFHDDHLLIHKIGRGRFSSVHSAHSLRLGGHRVAVKIVDLREDRANSTPAPRSAESKHRSALAEVEVLKAVAHSSHVATLWEASIEGSVAYLVLEFCSRTLQQVLEGIPELNEASIKGILRGMLQGIEAVHQAGIMHCDIRPANFMCRGRSETVMLIDFGDADRIDSRIRLAEDTQQVATPFTAPEVLRGTDCDEKIDIWSFGVCIYTFLYGNFPYMAMSFDGNNLLRSVIQGVPEPSFKPPRGWQSQLAPSMKAEKLVRHLLRRDPAQRPSASEALKSPFLGSSNVDPSLSRRSLKPMLLLAKLVGAFGDPAQPDSTATTDLDLRAAFEQQQRYGRSSEVRRRLAELKSGHGPSHEPLDAAPPPPEELYGDEDSDGWTETTECTSSLDRALSTESLSEAAGGEACGTAAAMGGTFTAPPAEQEVVPIYPGMSPWSL